MLGDVSQQIAILDANLLILLVTARLGLPTLPSFKRIARFTMRDVALLVWLLKRFKGVATTAYVLAEASNLANELSGSLRDSWFRKLAEFAVVTTEAHVPTSVVGSQPEVVRFGITDAALSVLTSDYILITSEYRLSGYLIDQGKRVFNFNSLQIKAIVSG